MLVQKKIKSRLTRDTEIYCSVQLGFFFFFFWSSGEGKKKRSGTFLPYCNEESKVDKGEEE